MIIPFEATVLTAGPALNKEQFSSLLSFVAPDKKERIGRFKSRRDAQNCLLADILARAEICRITGLENRMLRFSENKHGKPFLTNCPDIHFNASHSGHYISLVIDDEPAGIDIELIKPLRHKVAERFFAPDEKEYVMSAREEQRTGRFCEIWTMKEARIKQEGKGLSKPLPSFSVFDRDELPQFSYYKVFDNDEAVCHVCSLKKTAPDVRAVDIAEFLLRQRVPGHI